MSAVYLAIRMPDLLSDVARFLDPGLQGRPFAVPAVLPGMRACLIAVSGEARAAGARPGQTLAEAGRHTRDLVFWREGLGRLVETARAVRACVDTFAPDVAWIDDASGLIVRDRTGSAAVAVVADAVRRAVQDAFAVSVAIGIAGNRLAAEVSARLVAPRGVLHVLPGYERRMLTRVNVRFLPGVDDRVGTRLARVGIATIGDLADLPFAAACQAAGGAGVVLSRLARGEDPRPLPRPLRARITSNRDALRTPRRPPIDPGEPAAERESA